MPLKGHWQSLPCIFNPKLVQENASLLAYTEIHYLKTTQEMTLMNLQTNIIPWIYNIKEKIPVLTLLLVTLMQKILLGGGDKTDYPGEATSNNRRFT